MAEFVDAHVHFWDRSHASLRWTWLDRFSTAVPALAAQTYTANHLLADIAGLGVTSAVHVQAAESVDPDEESRWLDEMADASGLPDAIVAECSLTDPQAPALVRRHASIGRVQGIRDMTLPGDVTIDAIAPAIEALAECALSAEIRLPLDRFDTLADLSRRWPSVTFVLGSAGLPMGAIAYPQRNWADGLALLASHENWVCKVSGVIGRLGVDWSTDQLRPFVAELVGTLGADRVMFGTNWPVESAVADLADIVESYRTLAGEFAADETAALCHRTAARVYSLSAADR